MKNFILVFAFLFVPLLLLSHVFKRTTLEELINTSEWIVYGTVVSSNSDWDDSHELIWTDSEVEIHEVLKGKWTTPDITISQMGGVVGNTGLDVSGSQLLEPGNEAILFIKYFKNRYVIHSLVLGYFYVYFDYEKGQKMVKPAVLASDIIDPVSGKAISEEDRVIQVPLDQMISIIQGYSN